MRVCLPLILLLLVATPALAQPPAETCGAGDSLGGTDMLPFNGSLAPGANDFAMTGAGCAESGFDHVTCFTPQNSCTVTATCSLATLAERAQAPEVLQVGVNVVQGPCSTSPASCSASDSGTGGGTVVGVALTAGTNYCFVCESGVSSSLALDVQATAGDCGALPVELVSFEVQ